LIPPLVSWIPQFLTWSGLFISYGDFWVDFAFKEADSTFFFFFPPYFPPIFPAVLQHPPERPFWTYGSPSIDGAVILFNDLWSFSIPLIFFLSSQEDGEHCAPAFSIFKDFCALTFSAFWVCRETPSPMHLFSSPPSSSLGGFFFRLRSILCGNPLRLPLFSSRPR